MKSTRSNQRLWSLLVLSALILQACASAAQPQPAPVVTDQPVAADLPQTGKESAPAESQEKAKPKDKVKLVVQPFIGYLPLYIGWKEGYFAEQGLDVELVPMQQTQQVLPAVASGQADAAAPLVTSGIFNAIARGANIKITANKGYVEAESCVSYAVIGAKDIAGQIKSVQDLKGRTIDTVPTSWLEYYLAKLLESGGLSISDVETTDIPASAEMEAFSSGAMQFTMNSEPFITRYLKAGHQQVLALPQDLLSDSEVGIMYFGPNLLGKNADVGNRFMAGYLKAVRQYNQGPTDRNVELAAEFTQLDPALLKVICWVKIRETGEVNLDSLMDFQKWAKSAGYLDTIVPVEKFYDGSFAEAANQILGKDK